MMEKIKAALVSENAFVFYGGVVVGFVFGLIF